MLSKAEAFLLDPLAYVNATVDDFGYDTCHKIEGLDASECAKDCEELEKSDFAKKCAEEEGLFKCCIRYCSKIELNA